MLDKAIEHGKERRKPYRGAKAVDSSCCNHRGCPYCERNRTYKNIKQLQSAIEKENEEKKNLFSGFEGTDFSFPHPSSYLSRTFYHRNEKATEITC